LPTAEAIIGRLAPRDVIMRVVRRNPDSLWLFSRRGEVRAEGFQAFLLLNGEGRRRLLAGELDLLDPPDDCLVGQAEPPAMIYVWATFTPGILAIGIETLIDHFASPRYAKADLVSWSATIRGHRAMEGRGWVKGLVQDGIERPDLYVLPRSRQALKATRPPYDSYDPVTLTTGITVAHDFNDLFKVAAIRSAVYIGEQACPYEEEFDGNDLAATHLLAYVENEPVGCMRVRFFGDFAKLERLAVRKEYRQSRTAFELVHAAVELCRAKGFRKLYGQPRVDLLRFWQRFGFKVASDATVFGFSDQVFTEMVEDIDPPNDAVSLADGPYRVIRPEGQWHRVGILERSAARVKEVDENAAR
jgi:predicted GNAT family N-acyltransferase